MISFSGIDCSGKSTQINKLVNEYEKQGYKCKVVWSRGGYTPGISKIKDMVRGKNITQNKEARLEYSERMNSNSFKRRILFIASLIDLWWFYTISLRTYEIKGYKVICDRYIWDTYIDFKMKYREYKFEKGFWWKLTLKTMLKPLCSFVLIIPTEESMKRSELKYEPFPEPANVREERIEYYIKEIENKRWDYVIDASKSIDTVYHEILKKIFKY